MDMQVRLVSKVLVLDNDQGCYDKLKVFCDENNLVGLKVTDGRVMTVLRSNVDLGGIFLSASYLGGVQASVAMAREIHDVRPELPIFLRCDSAELMSRLAETDRNLFNATYVIDDLESLKPIIEARIFSLVYPNALVRGIAEFSKATLARQFKDMTIEMEAPYLVRDRIIVGEISTLIPLESAWCRGYMMLQAEQSQLLRMVSADRQAGAADDFRNLNNVLGEITNLIWGAFKNRFIAVEKSTTQISQVPIVINHLNRYISFGSEDAQLCFKYSIRSRVDDSSLDIHQRFIFNLNWSPEDFAENQASVESLVDSGELELF